MSNHVLMDNDTIMFLPNFGIAMVVVRPGVLKGSAKALLGGNKICLEGDEKEVSIPGCIYTTPTHIIPGTGTIKIKSLADNHKSKTLVVGGKPALLKGGQFTAVFSVVTPALTPPPPSTPDSTTEYTGQGQFLTKNTKWHSN